MKTNVREAIIEIRKQSVNIVINNAKIEELYSYIDLDDRDLNIEFYKEKNYTVEYSKTNDKICGIRVKDDEIVFTITGCEVAY